MEAEAKAAEEERKNNPEEGDDHDTRKLPKPERMRLVAKNKEVGMLSTGASVAFTPLPRCHKHGDRSTRYTAKSAKAFLSCHFAAVSSECVLSKSDAFYILLL